MADESEVYISFDLETDGTVAGLHSILSRDLVARPPGRVASYPGTGLVGQVRVGLDVDRETRLARRRRRASRPRTGCTSGRTRSWRVWGAWAFDFPFINYYAHKWLGGNPLGYSCLDIRTLAMAVLNRETYHGLRDDAIAALGFVPDGLVAHRALDDAIAQGQIFVELMRRLRSQQDDAEVEHFERVMRGTAPVGSAPDPEDM